MCEYMNGVESSKLKLIIIKQTNKSNKIMKKKKIIMFRGNNT